MTRHFAITLILLMTVSAFPIDMAMSNVIFKGRNEGMAYMETYLSYELFGLGVKENNDGSRYAEFTMNYQLLNPNGVPVDTFTVKRTVLIPEGLRPPFDNMELIPSNVKPGQYRLLVILTDADGKQQKTEETVTIPDYWKDSGRHMSDIFLIGDVSEPDSSVFVRYGKRFLPYPRSLYSPAFPMLQWIVELYDTDDNDSLDIYITKIDSNIVKRFEKKGVAPSGIEISGFNIGGFAQGEYILHIRLVDFRGRTRDAARIPFSFTREKGGVKVDSAQVQLIERMLAYLVSPSDIARFKALSPEGKLRFWNRIWEDNPELNQDEFINNWNYVAMQYETEAGARNGYRTDMGEIYLRFGPPDFVDRHALSGSSNPWEEWTYSEGMNAGYVIFGDVMNIGNMQVLSSDLPGYIEDENWRRKVARDHKDDPQSPW